MSEHECEYQLEGGRRYYYCECGETGPGIVELWAERIENQARIKALEGMVEAIIDYLIEQSVKNNNKADNSRIDSRTREFYEGKTSAYRDAKEKLLQLKKLEEV